MAIRFQVDDDFYDHPKTIGMSDSATALWVRAGSYSAAKLLDGLVPENVLSTLSTVPEEAASELVGRGLWRRVKGGYRFHQWDRRNLTRARVEADRESDRQRKRRERQTAPKNGNPQVNGHFVRPDSGPDSERNPGGFQGLSVSVSESVSVSGSGQRQRASPGAGPDPPEEPPRHCPKHPNGTTDSCGGCLDTRRTWEAWDRQRLRTEALARSAAARERAELRAAEIARCGMCDEAGYLPSGRTCHHDPARIGTRPRTDTP